MIIINHKYIIIVCSEIIELIIYYTHSSYLLDYIINVINTLVIIVSY